MRIWIPGVPVPQPRPRAVRRGNFVQIAGNPGKPIKDWKECIAHAVHGASPEPTAGACDVSMQFRIPPPKSLLRKDGSLRPSARPFPTGARDGDADNLAKPVLDVFNGTVFGDDCQVVCLRVSKLWALGDREPGVSVTVGEFRPFGDEGAMG